MSNTNFLRIKFLLKDIADTPVSIGNATYANNAVLDDTIPSYFQGTDEINGGPALIGFKTDEAELTAVFNNTTIGNYTLVAIPVQPVEFFGPHPIHRPH